MKKKSSIKTVTAGKKSPPVNPLFTTVVPTKSGKQAGDALARVKEVSSEREEEILGYLQQELGNALDAREKWKQRQIRWYKKRYGIRPKAVFPWPGASNLHIPLVDKNIRKAKPFYASLMWAIYPICAFDGVNQEDVDLAYKREQFYHWMFTQRMDAFSDSIVAIDKMCEKGFAVAKTIYRSDTDIKEHVILLAELGSDVIGAAQEGNVKPLMEWLITNYDYLPEDEQDAKRLARAADAILKKLQEVEPTEWGKTGVVIECEQVEYDGPALIIKDPLDVVVPADTGKLKDARLIFERQRYTGRDLRNEVRKGRFDADVVAEILGDDQGPTQPAIDSNTRVTDQTDMDSEVLTREGVDIQQVPQDIYEVWEAYHYFDVKGNGVDRKCVMVWCSSQPKKKLRWIQYDYDHGQWPFDKIYFDLTDHRHTAPRGYAEMLDQLQTSVVTQHNNKINRQLIGTSMAFKYIPGNVNPSNLRFTPFDHLPVTKMDDMEPIAFPSVDISFEREEAILKAYAEEYIGIADYAQANPTNMGGGQNPRTAREISAIQSQQQSVFWLDGLTFQQCWKGIHTKLFKLWVQYGPKDVTFRVMNEDPMQMTKKELRGDFDIVPLGRLGNTNPQVELQKAEARFRMFNNDPYFNQYELRRDLMIKDDMRLVNRLMLTQEQAGAAIQARAMSAGAGLGTGAAKGLGAGGNGTKELAMATAHKTSGGDNKVVP